MLFDKIKNDYFCIYQPKLVDMSKLWEKRKRKDFLNLIYKQTFIICLLTIVAMIVAATIGIPILEFIFSTKNLEMYRLSFIILMLSGGIWAFIKYGYVILVLLRKKMLVSYGCTAIVASILMITATKYYGTVGLVLGFSLSLFSLAVIIWFTIHKSISND